MNLFEYMAIPENKQKIAEKIEQRKKDSANYNQETWNLAKKKFASVMFPEKEMENSLPTIHDINRGETHSTSKETHSLQTYQIDRLFQGFPAEYRYNYCPICKKIIVKKAVLLNLIDGSAVVKYFVWRGENIKSANFKPEEEKRQVVDVSTMFDNDVLSGLKGGDSR